LRKYNNFHYTAQTAKFFVALKNFLQRNTVRRPCRVEVKALTLRCKRRRLLSAAAKAGIYAEQREILFFP
jgi:hypothetical protein